VFLGQGVARPASAALRPSRTLRSAASETMAKVPLMSISKSSGIRRAVRWRGVRGRGSHRTAGQTLPCAAAAWAAVLLPLPAAAAAPGDSAGHPSEALFLLQVVLLVVVGRLAGELMQRLGQPAVMGALLGGLLLGPSALGALWPAGEHALFPGDPTQNAMLSGLAQIGILLLLLLAGMETDLRLVRKVRRAAVSTSVTGIAIPFACGLALGWRLPAALLPPSGHRLVTALLLGTALSISSVKIVAMVVREMNFLRRDVGQVILAAAVIDDTIGWVIIAVTLGLAGGALDLSSVAGTVAGLLAFLAASLTLGRRAVFLVIRWVNDHFASELPVIAAVLAIGGTMALVTRWIGVHEVLGAFLAGILVGESPILTRQIEEQLRGLTAALFMPVFFGLSGLSADLRVLGDPQLLLLALGLVAIASIGKFGGAFLGAAVGGLGARQALALAFGMNARGSTEVIVASIGLGMGALSCDLYTMIVAMAVLTTMAMPPTLRWALQRLPMSESERRRLDREAFEETAFVPNLERLLLAADETAKGRFSARLAGLLAGRRGIPVTAFRQRTEGGPPAPAAALDAGEAVPDGGGGGAVDVVTIETEALGGAAVAGEVGKGYDLLLVGLQPTGAPEGGFDRRVREIADAFAGPMLIASARGIHLDDPLRGPLDILVPVNGTALANRGAEVAIALAQASGSPVCALYVARSGQRRRRRLLDPRHSAEASLKELVAMAEHYGVGLRTAVRSGVAPESAILRQARLGRHTLIVMGVRRRAREELSFGDVADAVLESADRSVLFVTGQE
jgi:Kef-type K+ transport system membrane component KefB/nucleotide-binding universal stress UspA family protein